MLRDNFLFAYEKKFSFAQEQIKYLSHWVSADEVATGPKKIWAMLEWPDPNNIAELRGYLGVTRNSPWNFWALSYLSLRKSDLWLISYYSLVDFSPSISRLST